MLIFRTNKTTGLFARLDVVSNAKVFELCLCKQTEKTILIIEKKTVFETARFTGETARFPSETARFPSEKAFFVFCQADLQR